MTFFSRLAAVPLAATMCWAGPASSQQPPPPLPPAQQVQPMPQAEPLPPPPPREASPNVYRPEELTSAGHRFFGNVSRGLASVIERAVSQCGLPHVYVLDEEGSGRFAARLGSRCERRLFRKSGCRFCDRNVRKKPRLPKREPVWLRIHINAALGWRFARPAWQCDTWQM